MIVYVNYNSKLLLILLAKVKPCTYLWGNNEYSVLSTFEVA